MTRALCSLRDWEVEWRRLWGSRSHRVETLVQTLDRFYKRQASEVKNILPFTRGPGCFGVVKNSDAALFKHQDNMSLGKQCTLRCISLRGQQERRKREGFRCKGIAIIYDNGFPRRALLSEVSKHSAVL